MGGRECGVGVGNGGGTIPASTLLSKHFPVHSMELRAGAQGLGQLMGRVNEQGLGTSVPPQCGLQCEV